MSFFKKYQSSYLIGDQELEQQPFAKSLESIEEIRRILKPKGQNIAQQKDLVQLIDILKQKQKKMKQSCEEDKNQVQIMRQKIRKFRYQRAKIKAQFNEEVNDKPKDGDDYTKNSVQIHEKETFIAYSTQQLMKKIKSTQIQLKKKLKNLKKTLQQSIELSEQNIYKERLESLKELVQKIKQNTKPESCEDLEVDDITQNFFTQVNLKSQENQELTTSNETELQKQKICSSKFDEKNEEKISSSENSLEMRKKTKYSPLINYIHKRRI